MFQEDVQQAGQSSFESLIGACWGNVSYLLGGDRLLTGLSELLDGLLVVSQILLAANKDDRETLAEVQNLRDPL